jgi:hypothetical protein
LSYSEKVPAFLMDGLDVISMSGRGEKTLQVLADDLMQHGDGRVAGRVPQGRDGRSALAAHGGLASHETTSWQWPAGTASLRVDGGRPGGQSK